MKLDGGRRGVGGGEDSFAAITISFPPPPPSLSLPFVAFSDFLDCEPFPPSAPPKQVPSHLAIFLIKSTTEPGSVRSQKAKGGGG